ncbi:hypothetical protein [Roseivirga sp.]|uniref:hypothetical protein n=1 Tax=Roseivirga sp. TaxID=1964215 RepID=UPI003B8E8C9C
MRKQLIILLTLPFLLLGCGEAGVESDISKTSELDFEIAASDLNLALGSTIAQSFDFANEDFDEYISDVEMFTLNQLEFEILELSGAPATTLDLEIRIDFDNNTASTTDGEALVSIANVPVANTTSPVLLYSTDASNPGLANTSVVTAFEQAVLNKRTVEIEITSSKTGADLTENFKINLLFDLTARVQLDN